MVPRGPISEGAVSMISRVTCVIAVLTALARVGMAVAAADTNPVPILRARAISGRVNLDGVLNDPVWQGVPVASRFTQREPRAGQPATEETEVRIVYTPSHLYVGIKALDSEPRKVVARGMLRDAPTGLDDSVAIIFDTFNDRRNGYIFATNANGVRTDVLISDEGDGYNQEWNGVWRAEARRTEEGWTAELEIPFSTLRFSPEQDTWGMNIRRMVRRKGEESYWSPVPLEADINRVSVAGRLEGLEGMSPGLNLRVKPFAVASGREGRSGDPETGDETGLDVKWGVGRGLSLDMTVNTDFAESEADEQQVNLTRFSLFRPEKREFFLENAGIFEFGPRSAFGTPVLRPFFSRRIGLTEDGESVPIEWGTRLTGRSGPWSVGVLGARTGGPDGGDEEGEDWGVVRVRRQVGRASFGLISTRHATEDGENQLYGLDADYNPTSRLKLRTFWAASDDTEQGMDHTGGFGAVYRGPVWRWSVDAAQIGEDFDPEAGFLLRKGVRRYTSTLTYVPRPDIPHVRNLFFETRNEAYTDLDGRLQSYSSGNDLFSFRTKSDDVLSLYTDLRYERLDDPFEIRPGVVIPEGEHRFGNVGIWGETNQSRPVSINAWIQRGSFYDGARHDREAEARQVLPGRVVLGPQRRRPARRLLHDQPLPRAPAADSDAGPLDGRLRPVQRRRRAALGQPALQLVLPARRRPLRGLQPDLGRPRDRSPRPPRPAGHREADVSVRCVVPLLSRSGRLPVSRPGLYCLQTLYSFQAGNSSGHRARLREDSCGRH